ncbi:MAG: hypothetical protein ACJ762_21020 [Solirubrobacteraceae bacterium]
MAGETLPRPYDPRDAEEQRVVRGPHARGTPLDTEPHAHSTPLPSLRFGFGLFAVAFVAYFVIGYWVTIEQHVVVFDAMDRLTRALLVWHNDPPKLAAIGFLFPPLTTAMFMPFAVIKPLATSLIALPLASSMCAATAIVFLDRTLARCDIALPLRVPLLLAFGLNPMWVFYAGNGMSEALYSAFLAFSLYNFVSWYATTEPRYLIGAGFGVAFLIVTRYAFIIWAALLAILIGVALVRRRASRIEVEGSVVAFAAPVVYALALWILFNALIVGEPFGWLNSNASDQAVNATGPLQQGSLAFNEVSTRLLELNLGIFPLALVAVPALVVTFLVQRNDMALWLASFVVLGIVIIGVHAYAAQNEGLLTLRDSMPMYVAAFVGAVWVYRSFEAFRPVIWAVTLALLVINFFTAWRAMDTYPFQSMEQAFVHSISEGQSQEGRKSRGGFTVGIEPEAQMAQYIKDHVSGKNAILTDNAQTFGVILLTGRPNEFFDRIDKGDSAWNDALTRPAGVVKFLLLNRNRASGDLITTRYPNADRGTENGLTPVFRTERYLLLRVAGRGATGGTATTGQDGTSTTPQGTSGADGVSSP